MSQAWYSWEAMFAIVFIVFGSILCIVGNTFVVVVIYKKKMTSPVYILIGSQALADILYGYTRLVGFYFCSEEAVANGRFALFVCEMTLHVVMTTYCISSLTVMATSIGSFLKNCLNKAALADSLVKTMVIVVWSVSFVVTFFWSVGSDIPIIFSNTSSKFVSRCLKAFTELMSFRGSYNQVIYVLSVLYIPLAITSVMYLMVFMNLCAMSKEQSPTIKTLLLIRNTKMLIAIALIYYILTLPLMLSMQFVKYVDQICETSSNLLTFHLPMHIYTSSKFVTPFILYHFDSRFKIALKRLLRIKSETAESFFERTLAEQQVTSSH